MLQNGNCLAFLCLTGFLAVFTTPRLQKSVHLGNQKVGDFRYAWLPWNRYITPEDVRFIGKDVLRHRIILSYEAEAEEISSEDIIQRLFDSIEIP